MTGVDRELVERVRGVLAGGPGPPTAAQVASALRAQGGVIGDAAVLEVTERLRAEFAGAGPLDALLRQPGVTDVLVNGPGEVWVDRGDGLERVAVTLGDAGDVRRLAQRLAAAAGRRLDDSVPWVDARIAGGIRLHAVLPPIAPEGPLVSLRVPSPHVMSMAELVDRRCAPPELVPWLDGIVRARAAFLVTGGTGTGKTTVLAAMLSLADPAERVVLVEDSSELRPALPHVVRLEARPANVEGAGAIGLPDLVRQALRMRPDRMVVGEVRGEEVVALLAAMNTGHEGSCGTVHANAAVDVPARLEALASTAGLDRHAVHAQVAAAIDAVVHLGRGPGGVRRIAEVGVIDRRPDGLVTVQPALLAGDDGLTFGPAVNRLRARLGGRLA